jgi:Holliday junction DNA helicase RuvA
MIASLSGLVAHVGADHAIIEVGGVGYLVQASGRTLAAFRPGADLRIQVETQVREDSITLFGFAETAERDWFRLLTGVQGVGGRLALAILSTLEPEALARAILLDDRAMIARAPGVGPRLAARLVTELKGKGPAGGAFPTAMPVAATAVPSGAGAEARAALEKLGFRPPEAARAVAEAEAALGAVETAALVRDALKRAAR